MTSRAHWATIPAMFSHCPRSEGFQCRGDAADCIYQLGRSEEALRFLAKARKRESEDAYVFDLESRILEDMGKLEQTFEAAQRAMTRDPYKAVMHHRVGQILGKQNRTVEAIPYFRGQLRWTRMHSHR